MKYPSELGALREALGVELAARAVRADPRKAGTLTSMLDKAFADFRRAVEAYAAESDER